MIIIYWPSNGKMTDVNSERRFELQSNENKRLQSHIASLKADNSMLKKKLVGAPLPSISFYIITSLNFNLFPNL